MQVEQRESAKLRWLTCGMATAAVVALEQSLLEPGGSRLRSLASAMGLLIVPVLLLNFALARWDGGTEGFAGTSRWRVSARKVGFALIIALLLPFVSRGAWSIVDGRAGMLEATLLSSLRNLCLGLLAFSFRQMYARLCVIVSLFLMTVAASLGGEAGYAVVIPLTCFAVLGTAWLMLNYWEGIAPDQGSSPRSPAIWWRGVFGLIMTLAPVCAMVIVGPTRAASILYELMPTSGGTGASDPEANAGVGDGEHEVAASENPQSVGFTDSQLFLETDRPSLYDAFNETYGEPFKPTKQEKMIAIGQQEIKEQKERPTENLQAGREFSTIRKKPETQERRPDQRDAEALVYVKGETPLHMPLATFCHFDGKIWKEEPSCGRELELSCDPGGSWMSRPYFDTSYLREPATHQIKIGYLDSSAMPLPPHVLRFRLGSVNRPDFFGWAQFGIVRMTDRTVPAGSVIESVARTVDPARLREVSFPDAAGHESDRHVKLGQSYRAPDKVVALARAWTAGVPRGWGQIEAVVHAMRHHHRLVRDSTVPEQCQDVVEHFLIDAKQGPDYLFATSTAVLLRILGYPTRVISGLYAAPEKFDFRTRHTPVGKDDVHFWVEVRMPEGHWIAVEPTPGYSLLPPIRSWSEAFLAWFAAWKIWMQEHWAWIGLGFGLISLLVRFRAEIHDVLSTWLFLLLDSSESRVYVIRTLHLIEARARRAGLTRPPGATPRRWYGRLMLHDASSERDSIERLVDLSDWALHAPSLPSERSVSEIKIHCRAVVKHWTLSRWRKTCSCHSRKEVTQ